jgi:hypothetical protein
MLTHVTDRLLLQRAVRTSWRAEIQIPVRSFEFLAPARYDSEGLQEQHRFNPLKLSIEGGRRRFALFRS